jgi:hypothetical protein
MRRRRTLVGALVTTRPRFRGKPLPRVETLSSLDESIDGQDAVACCDLEPTGHLMSNNLPPVFPKNTAHYPDHLGPSGLKLPLRLSAARYYATGNLPDHGRTQACSAILYRLEPYHGWKESHLPTILRKSHCFSRQ